MNSYCIDRVRFPCPLNSHLTNVTCSNPRHDCCAPPLTSPSSLSLYISSNSKLPTWNLLIPIYYFAFHGTSKWDKYFFNSWLQTGSDLSHDFINDEFLFSCTGIFVDSLVFLTHESCLPTQLTSEDKRSILFSLIPKKDQDNDELPWRKLSDANAINLAVCLLMLSYEAVSNIPDIHLSKKVSSILNRTGIIAINGQFREFQYDCWEKITLDQYFELISNKSGSLTSCACRVGAIMANGSEEIIELLDQFGTNLGIMSQIRNDLNDFLNFKSKKDFINNKKTLPYVYLLSIFQKQPQRLKDLTQLQGKRLRNLEDEGREYLKQIAIDEGVAHYCKVMYEVFRQRAYEIIMAIPVPKNAKKKLIRLVEEDV